MIALFVAALLLQAPAEEPRGSISGRCISAETGEGITGVQVQIEIAKEHFTRTALSGPGGGFTFERLPAGAYEVSAERNGYQWATQFVPIEINLDRGQSHSGLELKFHRKAVIAGVVTDTERNPLIGARVIAYRVWWSDGYEIVAQGEEATTDDRGAYRLFGLAPARYIVAALGPDDEAGAGELKVSLMSYYPSGFRPSEASRVRVRWGQEITDINLTLRPLETFSISGRVLDAASGGGCRSCMVRVNRAGELDDFLQRRASVAPDGSYAVRGLPAGSYRLTTEKPASAKHHTVTSRTVAIQNRNLRDVDLQAGIERNVSGRVVFQAPPDDFDPKRWIIWILLTESGRRRGLVRMQQDLTFGVPGLPAGSHRVRLLGYIPGGYMKAIRLGGRELPGLDIDVPEQGSISDLEILVGFDSATLTGSVKPEGASSSGHRVTAGEIVLIPQENQTGLVFPQRGSSQNGSFTVKGVPPGLYTVFAISPGDAPEIEDPDFRRRLASYGKSVELGAGKKVDVELVLAPEADAPQ